AVGGDQRLAQDHAQHGTGEIDFLVAAIDRDLAGARLDPDAGHRFLAAAGGIGAALGVALVGGLFALLAFRGLHLGLDEGGFQVAEASGFFRHGQAAFVLGVFFLYWLFFGFIAATSSFSGCCASWGCSAPG